MGQVPVLFGKIKTVADDEAILDGETNVFDAHIHLSPRGLAEEARCAQRAWIAGTKNVLQVAQRNPGVHDVLDDDDVSALERVIEVLQQPHLAGARRALRVAGDRDEIERDPSL